MSDREVDVRIGVATDGLEDGLRRAQSSITSSLSSVSGLFSSTNLAALGVMAAVGGVIAGIESLAANFSELGQQVGRTAQMTGIAAEELTALKFAAFMSDVSFETLVTSSERLARAMEAAQTGTGDQAAAFRALGVATADAEGNLRPTADVLGDIAEQFAGMEDGAGKTALAMALFGRGGAALIPLLNKGKEGIAELSSEAERLGVVLSKDGVEAAERYEEATKRLKTVWDGLKLAIGESVIPAFTYFTKALTRAMLDARLVVGQTWDFFSLGFGAIVKLVTGAAQAIKLALAGEFAGASAVFKAKIREIEAEADAVRRRMVAREDGYQDATNLLDYDGVLGRGKRKKAPTYKGSKTGDGAATSSASDATGKEIDAARMLGIETEKARSDGELAIKREAIAQRRALNQISREEELRQLAELLEEEHALHVRYLEAELRGTENDAQKQGQLKLKLAKEDADYALKVQQNHDALTRELRGKWLTVFADVGNGLGRLFDGMLSRTASLRDGLIGILQSIQTRFAQLVADQVVRFVSGEETKSGAAKKSALEQVAIHTWAAVQIVAKTTWAALQAIAAWAAQAMAATYAAIASIPMIGPFLAPATALAAGAVVLGYGARIASAEGGFDIPWGRNPVTQLHSSEMVLPAELANPMREMLKRGGGGGGDVNVTINTIDAAGVKAFMLKHKAAIGLAGAAFARDQGFL